MLKNILVTASNLAQIYKSFLDLGVGTMEQVADLDSPQLMEVRIEYVFNQIQSKPELKQPVVALLASMIAFDEFSRGGEYDLVKWRNQLNDYIGSLSSGTLLSVISEFVHEFQGSEPDLVESPEELSRILGKVASFFAEKAVAFDGIAA